LPFGVADHGSKRLARRLKAETLVATALRKTFLHFDQRDLNSCDRFFLATALPEFMFAPEGDRLLVAGLDIKANDRGERDLRDGSAEQCRTNSAALIGRTHVESEDVGIAGAQRTDSDESEQHARIVPREKQRDARILERRVRRQSIQPQATRRGQRVHGEIGAVRIIPCLTHYVSDRVGRRRVARSILIMSSPNNRATRLDACEPACVPTHPGRLIVNVPEGPANSEQPALDALVPSLLILVLVIVLPETVPELALRTNPADADHDKITLASAALNVDGSVKWR
jgi:hypothetical protein